MKRADSIDCPEPGCKAKIGRPCGYDPLDIGDVAKLMPGHANYGLKPGMKHDIVPWYHALRGDVANGEKPLVGRSTFIPGHWTRTGQ